MLLLNQLVLSKIFLKDVLGFPIKLMIAAGKPFKSSLIESGIPSHWDEKTLREKFKEEQLNYYGPIWGLTAISFVIVFVVLALIVVSNGLILLLPIIFLLFTFVIDGVVLFCRFMFFSIMQKEQSNSGKDLIPLDFFKDSSLESLVEEANKRRKEKEDIIKEWRDSNPGKSIWSAPNSIQKHYMDTVETL